MVPAITLVTFLLFYSLLVWHFLVVWQAVSNIQVNMN